MRLNLIITLPSDLLWSQRSREGGPFNQRLYARRNRPDALVVLIGCVRHVRTPDGLASAALDADGLRQSLLSEIGLSTSMIDRWADSGGMAASPLAPSTPPST